MVDNVSLWIECVVMGASAMLSNGQMRGDEHDPLLTHSQSQCGSRQHRLMRALQLHVLTRCQYMFAYSFYNSGSQPSIRFLHGAHSPEKLWHPPDSFNSPALPSSFFQRVASNQVYLSCIWSATHQKSQTTILLSLPPVYMPPVNDTASISLVTKPAFPSFQRRPQLVKPLLEIAILLASYLASRPTLPVGLGRA